MGYRIIDTGADRAAWLAARASGITATDIARLSTGGAGARAAIRSEKQGNARFFETAAMRHGKDREPVLAGFAYDIFGLSHNTAVLAAEDNAAWLATPDLLSDTEVGDIKTTVHDWDSWADVPKVYVPQFLWQMRVTGLREFRLVFEPHENWVPVYPQPKTLVMEYDEAAVALLEEQAAEFLASLAEDAEGDPDAAELDALVEAYLADKELADVAAAALSRRKAAIEDFLGGKPRKFEGSRANLTRSADGTTTGFAKAAFDKAHPDLAAKYATVTPKKGALTITARKDK